MTGATPTLSRCCPFSIPLALLLLNFLSNRYSCVLDGVDRAPWWLRDTICSLLLRDHHAISDHDSSVDLVQHVRLLVNAVHAFFELLELPADQQQPACASLTALIMRPCVYNFSLQPLLLRDHNAYGGHDSSVGQLVQPRWLPMHAIHPVLKLPELPAGEQQPACALRRPVPGPSCQQRQRQQVHHYHAPPRA